MGYTLMYVEERESLYFDESRRLTGPNLFFAASGAVLEAHGPAAHSAIAHQRWRHYVEHLGVALDWHATECVARIHKTATSLAVSAPIDQLFTATEVNEWAWETATAELHPELVVSNAVADVSNDIGNVDAAIVRLRARAREERNPGLGVLLEGAAANGLAVFHDVDTISVGAGSGSRSWPLDGLPTVAMLDDASLHNIPVVLVTGSNGKTTTVRLIAAMADAAGMHAGYSCTEGVFVAGEEIFCGDYSGPMGARTVLRDARVQCAVLETARGGMLRRGLAVNRADVAVVTNISADHFGEYGIDNLDDLADAKLIVANVVAEQGVLVLNAEDPVLMRRSSHFCSKVAVFAGDWNHPIIADARAAGRSVCAVRDGRVCMVHDGSTSDLGGITQMPLTAGGSATYNVGNIMAAALAAAAIGVAPANIALVLARFGATRFDNPGRLERWNIDGIHVLLDYAHNPAGLAGLMHVANDLQRAQGGRIGLLLGQAGNREDDDVQALARMAAACAPDMIILKDLDGMLRGREPGAVPAIMLDTLLEAGFDVQRTQTILDEFAAAKALFVWAKAGDVLVMPMHGVAPREALREWLDGGAPA